MRDDPFICAHCQQEKDGPPVIMPAPWRPRTGCRSCKAIALASPHARDFRVERNHKTGGTSAQAAHAAAEGARLGDLHKRVWRALHVKHMTADEVARELDICLNTARARCTDLRNRGFAEPTGEHRLTDAGRPADVLRAVTKSEQGRAA